MTTGEAGFRTQARGLATAISGEAREFTVDLRAPWRYLPGRMGAPFALGALTAASDRPAPPWPDLLISCGRRTTALSIAIRKASGGRVTTVHVQNPLTDVRAFDLVIAMDHDGLAGPNVVSVPTALHDVTPERLAKAAEAWRVRLSGAGPLAGVLLGGATRRGAFSAGGIGALIDGLARLRREAGARLAITPSRRTPTEAIAAFAARFAGDPDVFIWDGTGDNPYLGILALSERLVVTSDSVSMISEALATPHPVEVFGPDDGPRNARFLGELVKRGLARRFTGDPTPARAGGPVDATAIAAASVRRMLQARTGASG